MNLNCLTEGSTCSAVLALVLMSFPVVAAEQNVGHYGAPWCETLASLKPYVRGVLAHDTAAIEPLQDCVWLKAGVQVEVLRDDADFGAGWHVMKVRVYGNGTSVDGYTVSNGVEER